MPGVALIMRTLSRRLYRIARNRCLNHLRKPVPEGQDFIAALARREAASLRGPASKQEFIDFLNGDGGFVYAGFCGDPAVEAEIKEVTKATIRCIPLNAVEEAGKCVYTGKDSAKRVIFARAY